MEDKFDQFMYWFIAACFLVCMVGIAIGLGALVVYLGWWTVPAIIVTVPALRLIHAKIKDSL
jgi:hypothetical protein